MQRVRDTNDIEDADPGGVRKVNLFETPRFFADVHVLAPGQEARVHTHAGEDKCYHVLSGVGLVTCGSETYEVGAGQIVHCPVGEPHGVRNDGEEALRLLVFMAPHPRPAD